jgi:hypothetical protein
MAASNAEGRGSGPVSERNFERERAIGSMVAMSVVATGRVVELYPQSIVDAFSNIANISYPWLRTPGDPRDAAFREFVGNLVQMVERADAELAEGA